MVAVFWEHPNYTGRRLTVTGPIDVPCFDNWQFSRITTSFQISEWQHLPQAAADGFSLCKHVQEL